MKKSIEVIGVSKSFNRVHVLENVCLVVNDGESVGIVGSNGSGKSVLYKIICGLERPNSGEVIVQGKKVGKDIDFPTNIGILIDEPGFIDAYTGFDNLKFLAAIRGKVSDTEIMSVMDNVGLSSNSKTKVKNYSMGMKKKLGIAQAIMESQDVVLLDEPFNALDYKTVDEIKDIIKQLKADGKTILLTGHNHSDLEELCDTLFMVYEKSIIKFDDEAKNKYFKRG